ncbi:PAS domain-containing protein [Caenimonas sp. SL110]|uniref:PAS domain-containing protein n=1 Tax=Caenimonas sp. SL110 TaxID=1450524 RepID=UPI00069FD2F1|nr:PAS domain-containing protein [Caenimonas sp. SL110]
MVLFGKRKAYEQTAFPLKPADAAAEFPWVRAAWATTAVSGLLVALALVWLRSEALRAGERLTQSLTQVIGEQTSRTLQAVDGRLQRTADQLEMLDKSGTLNESASRAMLREQLQGLPFVRAIWVLDTQGRIVHDSDVGNMGVSLADREYFKVYLQKPSTELFIGAVVRSRTTGTWLISISRPLRDAAGAVKYVLVAAVEPRYFEEMWRSIDLGDDGAIAVFRRDGILMIRSPADDAALGRNYSSMPLFTKHLGISTQGVLTTSSAIDSHERVVAYRVLPAYPELIVAVGSSSAGVLAAWQRFALLTGLVWLAAVAGAAFLVRQVLRQSARRRNHDMRFRQLAQAMPQIVFITDPRGSVQFVNDRWAEATGHPVEEALHGGWSEMVHPDDRKPSIEIMSHMMRTGQELQREQRIKYGDGSYRWRLLRAVPIRDDAGKIVSWYGTSTDIDELKQAQERLRAQADLLSMAGRLALLGGWRIDVRTQVITWSDEASAILDMPSGQSPSLDEVFELFLPQSRDLTIAAVQACMTQGTPFDVEVQMVTATGRPVWIRSIGRAERDASGEIVAIQGAQQEITQRVQLLAEVRDLNAGLEVKIAERTRELAQQEALFRALAEHSPLPIWTCDDVGRLTFFSRAWYDLVGGEAPRWLGNEWLDLVHPDDRPAMVQNWNLAVNTGKPYAGSRRIRAADGTYHIMSYRAAPVRDAARDIAFWVGVESDITDLKDTEAALRLSNRELEVFSYSVSHDLRSPLQRVGAFSQLLAQQLGENPGEKALHYLARIRANVDHMTLLIDGLLSLSQLSQVELGKSHVDLSALATEIVERLRSEQPHRVALFQITPGLVVWADRTLLRSVLDNLLGNAWKFSSQREQTEIHLGGSVERGEYFVRDNGAGFDMTYAAKLFGTFQRLHSDAEFEGTGIGLATVARILARHGGRIWAIAEPGHGATFYFTLPAGPSNAP